MVTLAEVMEMAGLPDEVRAKIAGMENEPEVCRIADGMEETVRMLTEPEHREEAREKIRASVSPDPDGWKMLYFMM